MYLDCNLRLNITITILKKKYKVRRQKYKKLVKLKVLKNILKIFT